jgi:phosphate starvation-inducible PhoH-like protein
MGRRDIRAAEHRKRKNEQTMSVVSEEKYIGKGLNRRQVEQIKALNPSQKIYLKSIDDSDVTFGLGSAGTGKTYIAVAKAVEYLAAKKVDKLVFTRPAVEAGERLGFLPGDMKEKIDPYLLPIYDVLNERLGKANVQRFIDDGVIEISPLAFMRGRTFTNAFIVMDEMQNASRSQIKMALTRIGENTKVIFTGDPHQSDLGDESGLMPMATALKGVEGLSIVHFESRDVVRSKIVRDILARLEASEV